MPRNKLAPKTTGEKLADFLANLLWAIVWLGKWVIRLAKNMWIRR